MIESISSNLAAMLFICHSHDSSTRALQRKEIQNEKRKKKKKNAKKKKCNDSTKKRVEQCTRENEEFLHHVETIHKPIKSNKLVTSETHFLQKANVKEKKKKRRSKTKKVSQCFGKDDVGSACDCGGRNAVERKCDGANNGSDNDRIANVRRKLSAHSDRGGGGAQHNAIRTWFAISVYYSH
jgi:hypothetical protein